MHHNKDEEKKDENEEIQLRKSKSKHERHQQDEGYVKLDRDTPDRTNLNRIFHSSNVKMQLLFMFLKYVSNERHQSLNSNAAQCL